MSFILVSLALSILLGLIPANMAFNPTKEVVWKAGPILTILLTFICASILFGLIKYSVGAPGREMQTKFISLGPVIGRTRTDIIAVVGSPNAFSGINGWSKCWRTASWKPETLAVNYSKVPWAQAGQVKAREAYCY